MVPSKGRLSRMLVLTTVQFGHRKGRDKFMDAFIKHGNWFKNRGVLETLKTGEGRKAGRLGGFYCRADKSYWILELREGGFFHWTVASLCRVNNTREYETVVNTQKFNLGAVRISSCILIQFHLYNMWNFLRIHHRQFLRACPAQSRCLLARSPASFFGSVKLSWSS